MKKNKMNKSYKKNFRVSVILALFLFVVSSYLDASVEVSNFIIDNGGIEKQSSNYTVYSTIGEPVIREYESLSKNKTISSGFAFISDFTPPRILSVLPYDKDNKVKIDNSIEVEFDENINYSTTPVKLTAIKDNLENDININISGSVNFSTGTKRLTFTPSAPLNYNYVYKVELKSGVIFDTEGNPITSEYSWKFRTILAPEYDNVIKDEEKKTEIYFPAKALDEKGFVDISTVPVTVSQDKIEEANWKLDAYQVLGFGPDEIRELNFYDENLALKDKKFSKGVYVSIEYSDELANQLSDRSIEMCYLNEERNIWVKIKNFEVDRENKKITAKVYHFSFFAIFKKVNYDLGDVYAYPVPWKPYDGDDNTGTISDGITFTNLPDVGDIKVFTITGKLVKKIDIQAGYESEWDGKNDKGKDVASGVYIYLIENERNKKTGKLMIIR